MSLLSDKCVEFKGATQGESNPGANPERLLS